MNDEETPPTIDHGPDGVTFIGTEWTPGKLIERSLPPDHPRADGVKKMVAFLTKTSRYLGAAVGVIDLNRETESCQKIVATANNRFVERIDQKTEAITAVAVSFGNIEGVLHLVLVFARRQFDSTTLNEFSLEAAKAIEELDAEIAIGLGDDATVFNERKAVKRYDKA